MVSYLYFPIKLDQSIRSLKDNQDFVQRVKEVANKMKWNPNRTRRFKWNGSWMRMSYTNRGEFYVMPETELMVEGEVNA